MKHRNLFLTAAVAAALCTAPLALAQGGSGASSTANDAMTDKSDKTQAAQGRAALLVLMPITIAATDNLGSGCWARLYDDQNFSGDVLSLVGPIDMPNMRTAFGRDWSGEFDSVAVGPKARVTVYDNENYSQRVATFEPGQRIENLGGRMGLFEQVRSLKIACGDQARTGTGGQAPTAAGATDQSKSSAQAEGQPLVADPASPQGLRSFASLDKDGDGSISRAEWNAASPDRRAAAN